MIRLNQVHKYYGEASQQVHVLRGINLAIENGEMVSIMGSSGSGKSTLLNVLGILDSYSAGAYYLDNKLIEKLSEKQAAYLRNRHLGFVFQSFNLLPFKTARPRVRQANDACVRQAPLFRALPPRVFAVLFSPLFGKKAAGRHFLGRF